TASDGSAKQKVEEIKDIFGSQTRLDKMIDICKILLKDEVQEVKDNEPFLQEIVERVKPDVILTDHILVIPSLMCSSIPWVLIMSCNPLSFQCGIDEPKLPPQGLGLPTNGDPKEWSRIRQLLDKSMSDGWTEYNSWLVSKGIPSLPQYKTIRCSPFLNIYIFPEELDYTDIRQLPDNYHRFDHFKRTASEETFEVPESLRQKPGKLVYLSMGSMGSGDIQLMKRLVSILAKSKHRFIVSKGVFHEEYELAANMWGEKYLPQIKILSIVDLIITHGGNNTLTETMYFGKPFLVMPLFFDQFDNSQRIVEKGFGLQLDPYKCSETDLLQSIDSLLNDQLLKQKLIKASQRIQNEQNILKLPKLLESIAQQK
ncbi:unnamed protein product, partial [Medioppia subpectinata]